MRNRVCPLSKGTFNGTNRDTTCRVPYRRIWDMGARGQRLRAQLVTLFRPFLEYLAMSNLSPKTIQKHVDNMWVLGGEAHHRTQLHALCSERRQWRKFWLTRSRAAAPFSITATPRNNSDPSNPLAESSGDSSINHKAKRGPNHPQIPRTRQK